MPYFLRAYGISLIITFIYGYFNIWDASILLYIFLFLIFPLGKILYDKLFGFFLLHRLDAETGITAGMNRLFVLPIGFWFIVHFFIIFLAPIGFILLIILLYKQRKRKKEEEKT